MCYVQILACIMCTADGCVAANGYVAASEYLAATRYLAANGYIAYKPTDRGAAAPLSINIYDPRGGGGG